ncbi:MAG: hypothetical protein OXF41_16895 [bacterium]|nr:hypothetical protein [bacterium]
MSLHETLHKIRSAPTPSNEETAKFQILAPVLNSLGWDPFGQEVLYEHAVGGKGGGRVDIALDGPDHIVGLIEAKAPGQDLSKHVDQVIGYAFHQGVDICVLTTGLEWWLYLPMEKGPPEKRLFLVLQIGEDRVEQLADDFGAFLGRNNLLSGQARRKARQVLKARHLADRMNTELPKIWKAMLTEPDDDLVELVRQRAYEKFNLRPARQQAAAVLRGSPVPPVVLPTSGAPRPKPDPRKPLLVPHPQGKPKGIRLWGEDHEVNSWRQVLITVATELHLQHPDSFRRVLDLRGRKRRYASLNPDELRSPALIGSSGTYLETHWSAKDILKRVAELLELFDHSHSDLEILYD